MDFFVLICLFLNVQVFVTQCIKLHTTENKSLFNILFIQQTILYYNIKIIILSPWFDGIGVRY